MERRSFLTAAPTANGERQVTAAPVNHLLTNAAVWSFDGVWIYYDVRSDVAGSQFDGARIERVHVENGEVQVVYETTRNACCAVVTASPVDDRIVFIQGPEDPTPNWSYAACRRRGVVVDAATGFATNLDARNVVAPYTPGALRGGTHVHVFSGDAEWVSFTYEDHVLETSTDLRAAENQRNVGVAAPFGPVQPPAVHRRNHAGSLFSVLVTVTHDAPTPGSDQINRAYSDAWVGKFGYRKSSGEWQRRALAFLGDVVTASGQTTPELFIVDIPNDVTVAGDQPLQGEALTRPMPPAGTAQRRLTYTTAQRYPGMGGVRHWPRSDSDGNQIAFLMRDDRGTTQLWLISPNGGKTRQLTHNLFSIQSAFTWRADGRAIACVAGGSVCEVDASTGRTTRLTPVDHSAGDPLPIACVYSPDGRQIAFVRRVSSEDGEFNQIFTVSSAIDR
jgi:hypothetical protein